MANNEQTKRGRNSGIKLFGELALAVAFLVSAVPMLDRYLGLPPFGNAQLDFLIGVLMIIPGAVFLWWTIDVDPSAAKGAASAKMPTSKLITHGPYAYCRHPWDQGGLLLLLGFALMVNSICAVVLVLAAFAAGLVPAKKNEKELEARFGQEYLDCKKRTPFLLPLGRGK